MIDLVPFVGQSGKLPFREVEPSRVAIGSALLSRIIGTESSRKRLPNDPLRSGSRHFKQHYNLVGWV
jgi:hypothetical protein